MSSSVTSRNKTKWQQGRTGQDVDLSPGAERLGRGTDVATRVVHLAAFHHQLGDGAAAGVGRRRDAAAAAAAAAAVDPQATVVDVDARRAVLGRLVEPVEHLEHVPNEPVSVGVGRNGRLDGRHGRRAAQSAIASGK